MKKRHNSKHQDVPEIAQLAQALLELELSQKSATSLPEPLSDSTDIGWAMASRQSADEDEAFSQLVNEGSLIEPQWSQASLYRIFEESDILQACVRAYVDALARPIDLEYVGPPDLRHDSAVLEREANMRSFFAQVNESQSWLSLCIQKELDYWISGNAYIEVLTDRLSHEPMFMYHCPARFMRISALEAEPILVWVPMPRQGKMTEVPVHRRFRRFARWLPSKKIEWFKQLGDPRVLDRSTGKYLKDNHGNYILEKDLDPASYSDVRANSIWWFRDAIGGQPYGIPRWIASIPDIRGLYLSRWVNFDTLDHGGVPPWLLLIYGRLAPGTKEYLQKIIKKWRDPRSFSDPGVLEIEPNLLGLSNSGGAKAGAEFISMRDMRNEDSMFIRYAENCQSNIGAVFRLAGIHYGRPNAQGGTNEAVIEFTEKNVFEPLRRANDEKVTTELLHSCFGIYDFRIQTKRPPLGGDNFYRALGMAGRTGGPSLNELTKMCNEMFGTSWPERDHWFYRDISAAEAIGMVRSGQVSYDNSNGLPIVHPPAQGGAPVLEQPKLAQDDTISDAVKVLEAFQLIENRSKNYNVSADIADYPKL